MAANLTYSIADGVLSGVVHNVMITLDALSGGGGGSTQHAGNADTNNPYSTGVKAGEGKDHRRGGPIPTGRYRVHAPSRHPHLGLSCYLEPYDVDQASHMFGRGGFYIHGRGPQGSDGCIVPMEGFHALMTGLAADKGGTLFVLETFGGERFA